MARRSRKRAEPVAATPEQAGAPAGSSRPTQDEVPAEPGAGTSAAGSGPGSGKVVVEAPVRSDDRHTAAAELGLAEASVDDQYLTFYLAGDEYGIGILRAREILAYQTLTRVPTTPPWIRGVMNLRGSVVPVLDLGLKFGMPETALTNRTCAIVVEVDYDGEPTTMGILADSVHQVIALLPDKIGAPPAFGTRVDLRFLAGMGRVEDRFVLLLDIDRVLSAEELLAGPIAAIESASAEAEATEPEPTG